MDRHPEKPAPVPREISRDGEAYRFLMGEPDEAVYVFGNDIEDCNEAACRLFLLKREELIGRTPLDFSPELQADGMKSEVIGRQRFERAFAGEPQWFRWHYRKSDDRISEALIHIELVRIDGRRRLIVRARDLLDLERPDLAIAETERRFQQILDHTPVVAFAKDTAGRYGFINREFQRIMGLPRKQILGYTDYDILPPKVAELLRLNDQKVMDERHPVEFEELIPLGLSQRTYLSIKFPIVDRHGVPVGVGGISTDITARKRADEALRRAALAVSTAHGEKVFEQLVQSMARVLGVEHVFIAVLEGEGRERLRTLGMVIDGEIVANIDYAMAGTPCSEVCGRDFLIIPSGIDKRYPDDPFLTQMKVTGYAGYPLADAGGEALGLIAVLSREPLRDAAMIESMMKIYAVRAAAEIERGRAEAALLASEASHRAIFESSEDAIFVHDYDSGAIVDANPKACSAFGYTREELMKVGVADLCSGKHPYTEAQALRYMDRAKKGEVQRFEWHRRNKDGSLRWDEVVFKCAEIDGVPRVLAFSSDITARKQAEEGMRQAQKMEAIGHLTGGIAHDFNNILASIMGNIVLASDRESALADPRLSRYLDQANHAAKKARDLISQMLTYSRGRRGEPRPFALGSLLRQSQQLLRSSLPATVDFVTEVAEDAPPALIDPVQMEQVLFNLCINARDAMGANGSIRAGVLNAGRVSGVCASCRQSFTGDCIELFVADTGPGIAPELLERIFEPFFTTKEVGKGSGMGLSTVHGIVHEHGGHVMIETAAGKGTRFRVLVPQLAGGSAPDQTMPGFVPRRMPRTTLAGHVLVVDDEMSVTEILRDMLEGWGLRVTVARDGRAALALFASDPDDIDLVLTDQTMPRMTGVELAGAIKAVRPEVPIVLCTGYGGDVPRAKSDEAGVRVRLAKPVEPDDLLRALQAHLPKRG